MGGTGLEWRCDQFASGDFHIRPVSDLREHDATDGCWCSPRRDEEVKSLVIHNSMDRREAYEEGRAPQ